LLQLKKPLVIMAVVVVAFVVVVAKAANRVTKGWLK
jgi:hypothetical protein